MCIRDRYVIFIGDDDALMPGGLKNLAKSILETNKADAYKWPTITYWWPIDNNEPWVTNIALESTKKAMLKCDEKLVVENNLKKLAIRTIRHGFWRYSDLPMSYHNAISIRVYKEIAKSSGRVFHSNGPDFVTFLEIPIFADTVVRLPAPVSIFGISAKSNGGSSVSKNGKNVVQQFIAEYGRYNFHPWLPSCLDDYYRLYMDPFLVPLTLFPSFYGGIQLNYSAMWAFMRRMRFVNRRFVYEHLIEIKKCHKFSLVMFEIYCLANDFFSLRRKILNRPIGDDRRIVPEKNIYDFVNSLAKELDLI